MSLEILMPLDGFEIFNGIGDDFNFDSRYTNALTQNIDQPAFARAHRFVIIPFQFARFVIIPFSIRSLRIDNCLTLMVSECRNMDRDIHASNNQAPASNPFLREWQLACAGAKSVPQTAIDSFTEHPTSTGLKIGGSAAAAFALSCFSRRAGILGAATRGVAPIMGIATAADMVPHGMALGKAFKDNWNSDRNWDENVSTLKNDGGKFGVDLGLAAMGGAAGSLAGLKYFGWKSPRVGSLPEMNIANLHALTPGETTPLKFKSEGTWRQVDVHLPKDFDPANKANMVIGLDGILVQKSPGMAGTNGLADAADKHGFIGVFPHAQSFKAVPGVNVYAWHAKDAGLLTEGKALVPHSKGDDSNFISGVNDSLKSAFDINKTGIAGFSEGANLAHHAAAKLGHEQVQGVAAVAGTLLGTEAPAAAGMRALVVHGSEDPTIPLEGGAGGLTKILGKLGHTRMEQSNPVGQIARYTQANGFTGRPEINSANGVTELTYPTANGAVRYVELKGGQHAWPGRSDTSADKSVLSGVNGGPSEYPVNDEMAKFLFAEK